jgi:ParB-like chromosome segregation protein Spo0J
VSDLKIASDLRLQIEYVAPGSLVANELNPKKHPDRQMNALARNFAEAGFLVPVIIDQKNVIYAGHGRVLAALKAGISMIPAVRLAHLNDHQLRALMLADNRLAELGSIDPQLLAENLKLLTVDGIDLDVEAATAFTMGEIDKVLEEAVEQDEEDPDDAPVATEDGPPVNRLGDLPQANQAERRYAGGSSDRSPHTRRRRH